MSSVLKKYSNHDVIENEELNDIKVIIKNKKLLIH